LLKETTAEAVTTVNQSRIRFQDLAPGLTVYQIRLLLASILPKPAFDLPTALSRVRHYQKRNYAADPSHPKSKLDQLATLATNVAL